MEKKYIDANLLKAEFTGNFQETYPPAQIKALIDVAPAADVVPVVRCRDCKYYMTIHCTCDGCCISDNWFCADGQRRTQ